MMNRVIWRFCLVRPRAFAGIGSNSFNEGTPLGKNVTLFRQGGIGPDELIGSPRRYGNRVGFVGQFLLLGFGPRGYEAESKVGEEST